MDTSQFGARTHLLPPSSLLFRLVVAFLGPECDRNIIVNKKPPEQRRISEQQQSPQDNNGSIENEELKGFLKDLLELVKKVRDQKKEEIGGHDQ